MGSPCRTRGISSISGSTTSASFTRKAPAIAGPRSTRERHVQEQLAVNRLWISSKKGGSVILVLYVPFCSLSFCSSSFGVGSFLTSNTSRGLSDSASTRQIRSGRGQIRSGMCQIRSGHREHQRHIYSCLSLVSDPAPGERKQGSYASSCILKLAQVQVRVCRQRRGTRRVQRPGVGRRDGIPGWSSRGPRKAPRGECPGVPGRPQRHCSA